MAPREAELAAFVDALPVGAAMGHKAIAAEHPRYGQQAVRTSLGRLTDAGHLRWIKEHLTIEDNSMRWVTRTYWSREPKSAEWWAEFARERHGRDMTDQYGPGLARVDEEAEPGAEPEPAEPAPEAVPAEPRPEASAAHQALVRLRAADSRLALSERDCRALEPLAAEWLARGVPPADLVQELTAGLPDAVTNPGGFIRKRLESKMPPKPAKLPKGPGKTRLRARVTRAVIVCGLCEEPESSVPLINGLCAECRAECALDDEAGPPREFALETLLPGLCPVEPPVDVEARADEARRAAGLPPRRRPT
ncbi:hypothetical protein [Streptomyces alboflavus]|uniref:hypothetical protein n=1 Tax=Streptomyces alboflavus TaxID=67267 RepID=UPI0036834880